MAKNIFHLQSIDEGDRNAIVRLINDCDMSKFNEEDFAKNYNSLYCGLVTYFYENHVMRSREKYSKFGVLSFMAKEELYKCYGTTAL